MSSQQILIAAAGNTGSEPAPVATYVEEVFSATNYFGFSATIPVVNGVALTSTNSWSSVTAYDVGTGGSISATALSVAVDSSGNFYTNTDTLDATSGYALISKYNSSNVLQWQRSLRNGSTNGQGVAVNSSTGDVYVCGRNGGGVTTYLVKYNSTGTLQWQRSLIGTTTYYQLTKVKLDSAGNAIVVGEVSASVGGRRGIVAKYNSSGVIQWQRYFGVTLITGLAIDSSDNIYVALNANPSIGIAKYNSSGVIQWQRNFSSSSLNTFDPGIAVDASSNVYICVGINTTNDYTLIAKYNTSGVVQWVRKLSTPSGVGNAVGYGIATDADANVYVCGTYDADNAMIGGFAVRYSTAGALQWSRVFGFTVENVNQFFFYDAAVSGSTLYISGDTGTVSIAIKVPKDGSATGGEAHVYANVNGPVDGTATYTDAAGAFSDAAGTATDSANTLTSATSAAYNGSYFQPALIGRGGMVWLKGRNLTTDHALYDTVRGTTQQISSNLTNAQGTNSTGLISFDPNGFSVGSSATVNGADNYVSWTFAKNQNFFEVKSITHTTGTASTVGLGILGTVGCVMVKRVDSTGGDWYVWHRNLTAGNNIFLNSQNAQFNTNAYLSVSGTTLTIASGMPSGSYIIYGYAHNTATNSFIQCGSYTGNGLAAGPVVTLGWEPQFILIKNISIAASSWGLFDTARGMYVGAVDYYLFAQSSGAESSTLDLLSPLSTGFQLTSTNTSVNGSGNTHIYIAVRRGPMNQPAAGTDMFSSIAYTGTGANNFLYQDAEEQAIPKFDLALIKNRGATGGTVWANRLTANLYMLSSGTAAETSSATVLQTNPWDQNYSVDIGTTSALVNASTNTYIAWLLKRYPKVLDVVCYNGTGANTTVSHNLGVAPELIIAKRRTGSTTDPWAVGATVLGWGNILALNTTAISAAGATTWNSTAPTASVFSVGTSTSTNASAAPYVAWLFATLAGVSKVGSYTGNGTNQTINCGFSTGARLVIIKRTSVATGDWYIWDSTRGIIATNDPHLSLNTTAIEVTTNDTIDTNATGFVVNQVASTNVNVSGSTYLFIALA